MPTLKIKRGSWWLQSQACTIGIHVREKKFVKDSRDVDLEEVLLVMNWLEPGMQTNPHSHPIEQAVYIVKGTMRFYIGDNVVEGGAGSLIRIPWDVEHYGEPMVDELVLNLDVFNPLRDDYKHLVDYQSSEFV